MIKKIKFKGIWTSCAGVQLKGIKSIDYIVAKIFSKQEGLAESVEVKEWKDANNILIIRPGGMGDAILLIPIVNEISKQYPHVKIDVLCEKRNKQAFNLAGNNILSVYSYSNFFDLKKIFKKAYDVVIDTEQWHILSSVVTKKISTNVSIGFLTRPERKGYYQHLVEYDHEGYELENFKKLFLAVEGLDLSTCNLCNAVKISEADLLWAKEQLKQKTIAFFWSGSISQRRLQLYDVKKICDALIAKGYVIALLGGKDIQQDVELLEKSINGASVCNFVGKISLSKTAAIIKATGKIITTDSGLLHLADAVGARISVVFGPGNIDKWVCKSDNIQITNIKNHPEDTTLFGYTWVKKSHQRMKLLTQHQVDVIINHMEK